MSDLRDALDALIQPTRRKVTHDDGTHTWHTIPSLWEQLLESSGWGNGTSSTKRNGGRPPISTGVVSLIEDITTAIRETAVEHKLQRTTRTPGCTCGPYRHCKGWILTIDYPPTLRAITTQIKDQDTLDWWLGQLRTWIAQARDQLGLNPPTARTARQAPCPNCGEHTTYVKTAPKEYLRTPALAIIWDQPTGDDYHPDTDWRVGAVECRSCTSTWKRGSDLHLLYDQMLNANHTQETMTEGA